MDPHESPDEPGGTPQAAVLDSLLTCPHCGGWIEPTADHSGQPVACPHCGGVFQLPAAIEPVFIPPPAPRKTSLPPEPWFYEFIDSYAKIWMGIALLLSALCIVSAVILAFSMGLARTLAGGFAWIDVLFVAAGILMSAASLLGVILSAALLRLAVDAARNLRVLRHREQEKRS